LGSNNNYSNNRYDYNENRGSNSFNNGRGNYSNNRSNNNDKPKKHSGCDSKLCTVRSTGEQKLCIFGWNYSRRNGMVKFIASFHKLTKNDNWASWTVKVKYQGRKAELMLGLYDKRSGKLIIPDLEMVANPKAPNGGYFGRFYRTKN
jgi:hypothetical protein